jgi:predicted nucleotidyltransferase
MDIKPEYKEKIIALLNALFPETKKIYVFGSYARGTAKLGSDLDIALDAGKPLDRRRIGEARDVLNELYIPFNIDVVDFHSVPEAMQKLIIQDKIEWH